MLKQVDGVYNLVQPRKFGFRKRNLIVKGFSVKKVAEFMGESHTTTAMRVRKEMMVQAQPSQISGLLSPSRPENPTLATPDYGIMSNTLLPTILEPSSAIPAQPVVFSPPGYESGEVVAIYFERDRILM